VIIPTSVASAFLIVVLVIPGFVFGSIRAALRGPRGVQDTDLSSRIATSVMTSVVFDAGYLIAVGIASPHLVADLAVSPVTFFESYPLALGMTALVCAVLVPAIIATGFYLRFERDEDGRWRRRGGYRNFPTAWDRAAPGLGGTFVRIRLPDGRWVGGWYSSESAIGTYPHGRDIFIQRQYVMDSDGKFEEPVVGSSGVWLSIGDQHVVEWVASEQHPGPSEEDA
jgi:hypothetical protein